MNGWIEWAWFEWEFVLTVFGWEAIEWRLFVVVVFGVLELV